MALTGLTIADLRHPDFLFDSTEWEQWRETFAGGEDYRDRYLEKFSANETQPEFDARKECTPIPTFAKAAILDIRNAIFQRLADVSRIGGSKKYQSHTAGEGAGVDRLGASMNSFIGIDVLTEILVMGRCGVYVDAPNKVPSTMAEEARSPYLYYYRIEDILSWTLDEAAEDGTFKAVLLRDFAISFNTEFDGIELPQGRETRFRLVWKDDDGVVRCRFYDSDKQVMFFDDSDDSGAIELGIPIVPFLMPTIGDSLLKDVSSYQKALLNLVSGDVNWALKSNMPFLTIQDDLRTVGAHLKTTSDSAVPGGQPGQNRKETVGNKGRYYDSGMDRPDFIAPPTDPLLASMKLQEKLEDDIRKLINLAVTNKAGSRTESAEAKKLSSQGLEAGLSYIGTVLRQAEQAISRYWSLYENTKNPITATVSYPDRYILKEDQERIDEAESLLKLADRLPGVDIKKSLNKMVVESLLTGKQDVELIQKIIKQIDSSGYTSSSIEDIIAAQTAGLVSDKLASEALGYQKGEVAKAKADKADRAVAVLQAQTNQMEAKGMENPASRGLPDLDTDPESGVKEKEKVEDKKDE